jgi:hypothetical protein
MARQRGVSCRAMISQKNEKMQPYQGLARGVQSTLDVFSRHAVSEKY